MIKFALQCEQGHAFESWFRDNASFGEQAKRGFVECPACGSLKVAKSIMAPHVVRTDRGPKLPAAAHPATVAARPEALPTAEPAAEATAVALLSPADKALRDLMRAMRSHVEQTADHVGPKFADEALKMHQGEIDHRPIYGSATPDEAKMLVEEGVEFQQLPVLPDNRN